MKSFKTYRLLLTVVAAGFLLFACSEKIVNENGPTAKAVFRAYVGQSSGFEEIDLFILTVTGPDFDPITANLVLVDGYLMYYSVGNDVLDSTLKIPVGRNRLFTIEAYDTPATGGPGQRLIYRGQQRADVYPGLPIAISVVLEPMVPMIRLSPRMQTRLPLESFPVAVEAYHLPDIGSASIYLGFSSNYLAIDSVNPGAGLENRVPDLSFDEGGGEGYHYIYAASGNSNRSLTNADGYAQLAVIYFTGAYTGPTMNIITDIYYLGEGEGGIDGTDGQDIEDVYWDGAQARIAVDFITHDPLLQFPDYDLETAIMEYSGAERGNIHLSDVFGIMNLTWNEHEIQDLTGLNQLPNLKLFSASYCGETCLSDISGIAGCPKLEYLNLGWNDISDISVLAGLKTLRHLDLSMNDGIVNISALSGLTNLSYVDLSWTGITTLQPLIDNHGIGAGDTLFISCTAIEGGPQVELLESRGVWVAWGCK
jgi:hypothetical protein